MIPEALEDMEPGKPVFLPGENTGSAVAHAFRRYADKRRWIITMRTVEQDGVQGLKVWKRHKLKPGKPWRPNLPRGAHRDSKHAWAMEKFDALPLGRSVLFEDEDVQGALWVALRRHAARSGQTMFCRQESGGLRVWRVE